MNKDAILATVIGFVIGLIITALLLVGPRIATFLPKMNFKIPTLTLMSGKPTPKPTPTAKPSAFSIESPLDQSIESENTLLVSGSATAGATVVVQGNTDDAVTEVKQDGKFAGKITLTEGENDITVTSILKDKSQNQTVTVFYTQEQF